MGWMSTRSFRSVNRWRSHFCKSSGMRVDCEERLGDRGADLQGGRPQEAALDGSTVRGGFSAAVWPGRALPDIRRPGDSAGAPPDRRDAVSSRLVRSQFPGLGDDGAHFRGHALRRNLLRYHSSGRHQTDTAGSIADGQMAGLYRYADDLFDPDGRGPDARELLDHRPQGASHSARLRPDVDGELIAACGDAAVWNHLLDLDQRDHRAWAARPGISRRLDRAIRVLHQQR